MFGLQTNELLTKFLSLQRISGHPDAENITSSLLAVVGKAGFDLPLDRLVCLSTDGASVLQSPVNGVIAKLRERLNNPSLFVQHCCTHRLVLCAKDARKEIPKYVEKTIDSIMNYFQASSVRRDKFEESHIRDLEEMTDSDGVYMALVKYHKIRWLSLADCVRRLWTLLQPLVKYFREEKNDMKNQLKVRKLAAAIYEQIVKPEFHLFISFLKEPMCELSKINRHLQTRNQTIYTSCSRILALKRTFVNYLWDEKDMEDDKVQTPVEEAVKLAGGKDFIAQLDDTEDHGLLASQDVRKALKAMHTYLVRTVESLTTRFTELDFFVQTCKIMDPTYRKRVTKREVQLIVDKFKHVSIDPEILQRQVTTYSFDDSLDLLYEEECNRNSLKFFVTLLSIDSYSEVAKIALLLHC